MARALHIGIFFGDKAELLLKGNKSLHYLGVKLGALALHDNAHCGFVRHAKQ